MLKGSTIVTQKWKTRLQISVRGRVRTRMILFTQRKKEAKIITSITSQFPNQNYISFYGYFQRQITKVCKEITEQSCIAHIAKIVLLYHSSTFSVLKTVCQKEEKKPQTQRGLKQFFKNLIIMEFSSTSNQKYLCKRLQVIYFKDTIASMFYNRISCCLALKFFTVFCLAAFGLLSSDSSPCSPKTEVHFCTPNPTIY